MGLILKNQNIYENSTNIEVVEKALLNLANLTWQSENLKIRIHATKALASPSQKIYYGQSFVTIQDSLRIAKETADLIPTNDRLSLNNKTQFLQELRSLQRHLYSLS